MSHSSDSVTTRRVAVINMNSISPGSTLAHNRIAQFLGRLFNCPVFDRGGLWDGSRFDTVFVVNGLWHFCSWREEIIRLAAGARVVVWCGNDYALPLPKPIRELSPHRWCEFEDSSPNSVRVNWNELTFVDAPPSVHPPKVPGVFYWGACREGRKKLFEKYFGGTPPYEVTISCTAKAMPEFFRIAKRAKYSTPLPDVVTCLQQCEATLYLEDEATQTGARDRIIHSPANRFYEAMSARILTLFDVQSVAAIEEHGFDVRTWTVSSQDDVDRLLREAPSQEPLREQVIRSLQLPQTVRKLTMSL